MTESRSENAKESILDDFIAEIGVEFGQWFKKHPDTTSGSGVENRCVLVKEGVDFELVEVSAREAVYWFDNLPEALYTSADGDEQYDDLQHYINNLEDFGKSSLFVKLEKFASQTNIETPEEKEVFDSMEIKPREMTQPRLSSCETVFSFSHGERRFILRGIDTDSPELEVVRHETPQQREECERLERGENLMNAMKHAFDGHIGFCSDDIEKWARIADKTNYRKEG